jgi:hypothetical protein
MLSGAELDACGSSPAGDDEPARHCRSLEYAHLEVADVRARVCPLVRQAPTVGVASTSVPASAWPNLYPANAGTRGQVIAYEPRRGAEDLHRPVGPFSVNLPALIS